jgi:AcrR family transcriptional regulator
MVTMCSAGPAEGRFPPAEARPAGADRTARARIRDAAIARIGDDGFAATSVRAIAADAGVSPALVLHHFGSKDGLRVACDTHVAAIIREGKSATMASGPGLDMLSALRRLDDAAPVLRYLARVLTEPSPRVAALVDDLVADAVGYLAEGERSGILRPSRDGRARAVVLTLWSLGALVLHGHAARLLGADLLDDAAGLAAYTRPAAELLGEGLLTPEAMVQVSDLGHRSEHGEGAPPGPPAHTTTGGAGTPPTPGETR